MAISLPVTSAVAIRLYRPAKWRSCWCGVRGHYRRGYGTAEGAVTIGTGGAGALAIPVAVVGVTYGVGVAGIAAVHLKSDTEPTLPDKKIASGNGVTVEHNYRGGDHPPAHAHVVGGSRPETRIGPNGKPLKNNPELTAVQKAVVQENKSVIRNAVNKIARWLDFMGF